MRWYLTINRTGRHVQDAEINEDNYICNVESSFEHAILIAATPKLREACKIAQVWFEKHTNDEPVWETQPSADMATIMSEAITEAESGTPAEPQHGREPEPKPLAQYLTKYIEHEIGLHSYNPSCELLEQALNAYESTENVKIKIEKQ